MAISHLEQLLEYPERVPFYDLLGGLADNLLTIGSYAGTFMACAVCGDTFSLKGQSWKCEECGQGYEPKFQPVKQPALPFEATVKVTGLSKPRSNPHWYFENENWSVAEFLTHILRLTPEVFLGGWFRQLGLSIDPSPILETILCWPRFRFGGKTIQPDLAVGFQKDIVFIEFKRPEGAKIPPREIMGQLCFAMDAARRQWHSILIPGQDKVAVKKPLDYVREALVSIDEA